MASEEETARVGFLDVNRARTILPGFAAGQLLTKEQASILDSGDTATKESLRNLGSSADVLAAVFVETSFPCRLESLA